MSYEKIQRPRHCFSVPLSATSGKELVERHLCPESLNERMTKRERGGRIFLLPVTQFGVAFLTANGMRSRASICQLSNNSNVNQ